MPANGLATETGSRLQTRSVASLATLALDGLSVAGFFLLQPLLTQGFASQHPLWGALVVTGYLVLCLCTWMLMRLKPHPQSEVPQKATAKQGRPAEVKTSAGGCISFLALCFGCMVVVMLIELSGALEEGGIVDRFSGNDLMETALALMLFILPLLYLFVVILKPRPVVEAGTAAHLWQRMVATLGINLMFIITLAFWDSSLADSEPMGLALSGRIFVFLLVYATMLMFMAPPRLILHSIEGKGIGLASFCFWLAAYTWKLTT